MEDFNASNAEDCFHDFLEERNLNNLQILPVLKVSQIQILLI